MHLPTSEHLRLSIMLGVQTIVGCVTTQWAGARESQRWDRATVSNTLLHYVYQHLTDDVSYPAD